jgi:hypothetical protein
MEEPYGNANDGSPPLETQLIEKCWKAPEFMKRVVSDLKGMRVQA